MNDIGSHMITLDPVILSRVQFALTVSFHYIFPVFSIGLGLLLVVMEGLYLKTGNETYHKMTHFWVSIFALIFGIGVATGIVMEFQFGTNWSNYSRFVGDVFGSALAAEGLFAFFLESGFLAILLFGWNKVSKLMHFVATVMVALGAHFSAVWIVVANSWQQTPAGFHLVEHNGFMRAEITDFWAMVFNPSSVDRLIHVILGAWVAGAFLVVSVSAYYLLKNRDLDVAKAGIKMGLIVAFISCGLQMLSGHSSAVGVSEHQPAKLAAMEGHYVTSESADLSLFGWVDEKNQKVIGPSIPGGLSFLLYQNFTQPVAALDTIKEENRPPVQITFQSFHLMVGIGIALSGLAALGLFLLWRGTLYKNTLVLLALIFSVILPQVANQAGWVTAEVGRQPWVVYGLLKTKHGISPVVKSGDILFSIILFSSVYLLLFALFIFLLNRKIQKGPDYAMATDAELSPARESAAAGWSQQLAQGEQ
ncbi:MAG: cytochrome ubiquinol oxidase subunit I [Cyanobacteria bacterium P01_H01_bin.74]